MKITCILLVSLCLPTAVLAQCTGFGTPVKLEHEVRYGVGIPGEIGIVSVPLAVTAAALDLCEDLSLEVGSAGFSASISDGNDTYGVDFDFSILGATSTLVDMFTDPDFGAESFVPSVTANCNFYPEVLRFSGGPSAYVFQAGDPGAPNTRTAGGKVTYCDVVQIVSTQATVIELPYDVQVSLQAAESFGDAEVTRGFAQAQVMATIDGLEVVNDLQSVESVSVIPEQATLGSAGVLSIPVAAGVTNIDIMLFIDMKIECVARSGGPFGILSGAAEAGIIVSDSPFIGRFQGVGGAPLPEDVDIRSTNTGIVYKGGIPTAIPGGGPSRASIEAFPNPSTRATTIALRNAAGSRRDLRIVDARGRLVRDLTTEGDIVVWDGRDERGVHTPSGVYFAVAKVAQERLVRRIVLLR